MRQKRGEIVFTYRIKFIVLTAYIYIYLQYFNTISNFHLANTINYLQSDPIVLNNWTLKEHRRTENISYISLEVFVKFYNIKIRHMIDVYGTGVTGDFI